MVPFSATLTHGLHYFWSYLAVAALAGLVLAWVVASLRAGARAAAARDDLRGPAAGVDGIADGEHAVLCGVLEIDGAGTLAQDAPGGEPASTAGGSTVAVFLRAGDTRVALRGDLDVRAGSRECWGLSRVRPGAAPVARAKGPRSRLRPLARWLADRQRVRARGIVRVRPATGGHAPREDRHAMFAPAGGRIELAAERRPRVRLHAGTIAASLAMAAALYAGVAYVAGWIGAHTAWELARGERSEAQARRVIRWAKLGGLTPFHRERSLAAIGAALDLTDVADPQAQRGLVDLAASYEHHLTGSCGWTLDRVQGRAAAAFTAELAERCADPESLRAAARARLVLGELDRAADLVARAAALDRSRPAAQVLLERSAFLLTGRLDRAAAAIRETQARVGEFYVQPDEGEELAHWQARLQGVLGCAADQLSARAGDGAAHARLQAASSGSVPRVRWTCALLLADLAGAERLALAERIRGGAVTGGPDDETSDPIGRRLDLEPIEGDSQARWNRAFAHRNRHLTTLDLLELEAEPARVGASRAAAQIHTPARILAGGPPVEPVDAVKWAALERLSAVAHPAPAVRRQRAILATELVVFASLLGDDGVALTWMDMLERDRELLAADVDDMPEMHPNELAIRRAYVELRAGHPVSRPAWSATPAAPPGLAERRRELQGVLDFVERGSLVALRAPGGWLTFADNPGAGIFEGLQVAARGSGDELAGWLAGLELDSDRIGMAVALLGSRRVTTGRPAMLAWLRRTRAEPSRSLAQLAVDAASRQKIAEALGDHSLAAGYRARAERMRRGLLRRDTALVRRLLAVD